MKKSLFILFCFFLFISSVTGQVSHSMFIAGPQFTGIIGEDNTVIWDAEQPRARDGYVLENGNILICWADEVKEFNLDREVVFRFERPRDKDELGTAFRLPNGNTMITVSGVKPQIIEVNAKGIVQHSVDLLPETNNTHMQTRMARKLQNGNYLVPHLLAFKVKEYQSDGTVVSAFETDLEALGGRDARNWPFTAIRLHNGNTLVTLTNGNKVVEMNAEGRVVWKLTNDDLEGSPLVDPCGAQRLPNGNTVITSYGAKEGIRLLEVDREKNIVWTHEGHNAHHFQILTTNGEKLEGVPMK